MASRYTYVVADGTKTPGSQWYRPYGVRVYDSSNGAIPPALAGRTPKEHTWGKHLQRRLNDEAYAPPTTAVVPMSLRDYQTPRVEEIVAAHADGAPGYLLSYPTGSGKTYISVAALNRMRPRRVLVIAPVSHLAGWRSVISRHADGPTEWVVINPDRLHTLFMLDEDDPLDLMDVPEDERVAYAINRGRVITEFDVVVTDESQILAHADTGRASLWRRLIGWRDDGRPPRAFTLNLSATAWSHPQETASAAPLLASAKGIETPTERILLLEYPGWLRQKVGVDLRQQDGKWDWRDHTAGVRELTGLLFNHGLGATASREDLGLPNQERGIWYIDLPEADRQLYDAEWTEFARQSGYSPTDVAEPSTGREAYLRAVQKAAIIKAPYVAELVTDYLQDGYQVVLAAWFQQTLRALYDEVNSAAARRQLRVPPARQWALTLAGTSGDGTQTSPEKRDAAIRMFQSGLVTVLVTSVSEAISLHAGQQRGGINHQDATDAPRVTIFGDVLHGGKKAFQAEGRAARDGRHAEAIYCIASGTKEVKAFAGSFRSLANTRALTSDGGQLLTDADIRSFTEMATELEQEEQAGQTR